MKRFIIFLVRRQLGLKKYECFRFSNQKSLDVYYFTEDAVMKKYYADQNGWLSRQSTVSLNWLLDKDCRIYKINLNCD